MLRTNFLGVLCLLTGLPALAADLDVYNQLTYRKMEPGRIEDNIALVRKWVLPVYKDRVAQGEVTSYELWRVRYPAGGDYDLVSVTVTDAWSKLAPSGAFREAFDRVHGERNWDRFLGEIRPTGHVVRTEIWRQRSGIGAAADSPDPFIRVNFVRTRAGMAGEYEELLDNLATPYWQEWLKTQGSSWSTWRLLEPGPGAAPHDFATSTGFAGFADMAPRNDVAAVFARAHPDKNLQEVSERFQQAVTPARQETWELVATTAE